MTLNINDDAYDENSVFNRLFAETPKTRDANPTDRLNRVFEKAKAHPAEVLNETINVRDFLPIY